MPSLPLDGKAAPRDVENAESGSHLEVADPKDHRTPAERAASDERRRTGRDPALPPNHPINALSPLRKALIVFTVSYSGFLCNFSVAIANVAFGLVGEAFGVSAGAIANALGYNLLGAAVGPLIWNPLSRCIGRRPVYLIGSFLFIPACIWQAQSNTYPVFVVGRVFAGIVASWSQTLPPASIADVYVPEVRGARMSAYAVPSVLGPVAAPIFAAGIVQHHGWRNLWYFNLGLAGLQFLMFLFLSPETLWNEYEDGAEVPEADLAASEKASTAINTAQRVHDGVAGGKHEEAYLENPNGAETSSDINNVNGIRDETLPRQVPAGAPRPGYVGALFWPHQDWKRFWPLLWSPIQMFSYAAITLPSFYYGICLGLLSVGVTVVFPQIFAEPPYSFALVPLGAAFLAFGIGGVIGIWFGGQMSDHIVAYCERRAGRERQPEDRLWAGFPMFPLMFLGLLLCGLCVQLQLHWMCFLVGGAIAFFALSGITTVITTYTLESYLSRAQDTQAVFTFFKFLWGFVVPFFVMKWGEYSGWIVAYVGQGIILLVGGVLLCVGFIWKGYNIRRWQGMPVVPIQ